MYCRDSSILLSEQYRYLILVSKGAILNIFLSVDEFSVLVLKKMYVPGSGSESLAVYRKLVCRGTYKEEKRYSGRNIDLLCKYQKFNFALLSTGTAQNRIQ